MAIVAVGGGILVGGGLAIGLSQSGHKKPVPTTTTSDSSPSSSTPDSSTPNSSSPGSSATSSSPSTTAGETPAQEFESFGTPFAASMTTFGNLANAWDSSTTTAQAVADAAPAITALHTFHDQLITATWPANSQNDTQNLADDIQILAGDLETLPNVTVSNESAFVTKFKSDAANVTSDEGIVRQDLGLPVSTPTT